MDETTAGGPPHHGAASFDPNGQRSPARAVSGKAGSIGISVYHEIKQAILLTRLRPGEKLGLRELSEQHGCGTSPIREALNQLVTEGWVNRIDKRGFFVASASRAEFDDILWSRCFIEAEAFRRSIALGDRHWEERVLLSHYRLSTIDRSGELHPGGTLSGWEIAHRAFHAALVSACGSPILLWNCSKLYELNIRYRFLARKCSFPRRSVSREHDMIKEHALARHSDAAVDALVDHYRETSRYLSGTDGMGEW